MYWQDFTEDDPPAPPERPTDAAAHEEAAPPDARPADDFANFEAAFGRPPAADEPPWEPPMSEKEKRDALLQRLVEQIKRFSMIEAPIEMPSEPEVEESESDHEPFPDWVYEACQLVPKDMIGYKEKFPVNQQKFLEVRGFAKVLVTEIHNPYKFYFQLAKEQRILADMMEDLRLMYARSLNENLMIRKHEVKVNLLVAAVFDGVWHRARLISEPYRVDFMDMVKVYYVDYGTVAGVRLEEIRFLHRKFLDVPELCYRGSLCGIVPTGRAWTIVSTKVFLSYVYNRIVYMFARSFEEEDMSWHVDLVDIAQQPTIVINNALIKRKLAFQAKDFDKNDLTDYMARYKRQKPSFDELSSGTFPTFSELLDYKSRGIEFEVEGEEEEEEEGAVGGEPAPPRDYVVRLHKTNPFAETLKEIHYTIYTTPRGDTLAPSQVAKRMNLPKNPPPAQKKKEAPPPPAQKKKRKRGPRKTRKTKNY